MSEPQSNLPDSLVNDINSSEGVFLQEAERPKERSADEKTEISKMDYNQLKEKLDKEKEQKSDAPIPMSK